MSSLGMSPSPTNPVPKSFVKIINYRTGGIGKYYYSQGDVKSVSKKQDDDKIRENYQDSEGDGLGDRSFYSFKS